MKRRVSVLTPTFNHEHFISDCIESVLTQTFKDWEQIIIDDGSTDKTREQVERYKDDRIRYFRQENKGPERLAQTYNTALSHASGDLIAILEGDDLWPSDKLARMVPLFDDPEIIFSYGELQDVEESGEPAAAGAYIDKLRSRQTSDTLGNRPVGILGRLILSAEATDVIAPATVIIRRSTLESIGGFRGIRGLPLTDYPTFLPLTLLGKFHYVPRVAGMRRRHIGSVTCTKSEQIFKGVKTFALEFMEENALQLQLRPHDREEILSSWYAIDGRFHAAQGRLALVRGEWAQARSHYRRALQIGNIRDRMLATAGWVLSFLKCDMERLIRTTGRPTLKAHR